MAQYSTPFETPIRPDSPVETMAEQLVDAHAAKGFAELHDLRVKGWPEKAIFRFGPAAVVLAGARAERRLGADLPARQAA